MKQAYFKRLYRDKKDVFFSLLEERMTKDEKTFVVTANPEIFMRANSDEAVDALLTDEKTLVVADGIGVLRAAQTLGEKVTERIPGVEIAAHLIELCKQQKKTLFLYGAKQEVLDALREKIGKDVLLYAKNGYDEEREAVMEEIARVRPDVVLVALGVPHQELLLYKHLPRFDKGIFVGVGGSFDVLSGQKRRAPRFFVKCNLEWLWRILSEPSRFKRFFRNNVPFVLETNKLKRAHKKQP